VVPFNVVIVELPPPAVRETVLPLTGLVFVSKRLTVIVEVVEPSAVIDVGFAVTVDVLMFTGPVTISVPVLLTVPPPVACTVNVYVLAGTATVVVSVNVVAAVGHLAGFGIAFAEKFEVTPLGKPDTENEIVLLLPL
jgi:hypothetical protein